ncbi:MAG TPA: transglutaminaseTgpA domain-containing protein, partial [Homoserinimonas sp.]|nr:transglutaminaseTgpA domain-containing protein [Homoserinimonas sp.]
MSRATIAPGFIAINTMMVWAAFAFAGAALWPIYESERLVILIAVSLAVGSAIAIFGAVSRWSSALVMLAAVAAYLLLGVPLAVPDQALYGVLPSLAGVVDLLAGTAIAWKQLLTITLPVGSFEVLLVPAFLLILFGTVIALSVALRAKYGEVAVVIPTVIFVAAVAFGPVTTDWPLPLALSLLVMILVWLIWARWYRRQASIRLLVNQPASGEGRVVESRDTRFGYRALLGSALTMTMAVSIALGAVWLFPVDKHREVLRSAVEEPFDPRDHASPLSGFRTYHQEEAASRPMFTVEGLPEGSPVRVATLDTYDGIVYSVGSDQVSSMSGSFVRVPTSFDQSGVEGDHVTLQVTIDQYEGIWMPSVGKLERVTFAGDDAVDLRASFFYNDNSGTAVVVDELAAGDSYRVQAVLPFQPDPVQLAGLEPGNARVPEPRKLPEELALALGRYVGDAQPPGARLQAMLDGLRADGYISHGVADDEPASRSGHAADRITQLLTDQRMIGDAEQYAVTAALMAGQLGFPARVVFGFAPDDVNRDGVVTVHGEDISAWIEVNTSRFGWIALDPNPEPREIPEEEPEDPTQVARPQSPVQPPPTEP